MDDTKLESTNVCVLYRFGLMAHPPRCFFFPLSCLFSTSFYWAQERW